MSTARTWILLGTLAAGLFYGGPPLRAQSADLPVLSTRATALIASVPAAGRDDASWNRGVALDSRQAARELLLEGNRLFKIPLFGRAAEKYKAALATWPHPAFHFNLALAELNLGDDLAAHDNLEAVLRDGDPLLGADRIEEARKQLEEVERRLGRLRIRCDTPGAVVTLDGVTLFHGPGQYEGWAEVKAHQVAAKKPAYLSQARRVTSTAGRLDVVELTLITLDEAAEAGRPWAPWKPWTVVAAGAVVAAAAGTLHAVSARKFRDYDAAFVQLPCASNGCTQAEIGTALNRQLDRATLLQRTAVGGYIAGGAFLAAGVTLVYLNRPRLVEESATERIAVTPTASSDMVGLVVTLHH